MTTATTVTAPEPDIPTIVRLDIATLVGHPANRAVHDDDIEDLTESMKSKIGLLQFPVVVPVSDDGYRIIVGHSRIKSAQRLGWATIPCIVRDDLDSAQELIALLGSNDRHRHFTPSQRARIDAELALLPEFKTAKAIAAATQRSSPEVAGSLALHRLGKRAHSVADSGQLTLDDAIALEELGKSNPKAVDQVLRKATNGYNFHYAIAEAHRKQRRAEVIAATTHKLSANGVTVITTPKGFPYSSKIAPLDHLEAPDGAPLDADELRTRDGFAAVVDTDYGLNPRVTYVCLDPESFGYRRTSGSYTNPDEQRADAERAARESEHREQLATAATVRLKWLRQALATQAKAKAWLDDALRHYVLGGEDFYPDDTADQLCAGTSTDTITTKRATHRFVAVIIGALHDLAFDPVNAHTARDIAQFYDLISAHGYELTEVEQAERETCHRLLASDQDGEDTEDGHESHHEDEIDLDHDPDGMPASTQDTKQPPEVTGTDQ